MPRTTLLHCALLALAIAAAAAIVPSTDLLEVVDTEFPVLDDDVAGHRTTRGHLDESLRRFTEATAASAAGLQDLLRAASDTSTPSRLVPLLEQRLDRYRTAMAGVADFVSEVREADGTSPLWEARQAEVGGESSGTSGWRFLSHGPWPRCDYARPYGEVAAEEARWGGGRGTTLRAPTSYGTVEDLLGHLVRDYGPPSADSTARRAQQDTVLDAAVSAIRRRACETKRPVDVLVPGVGVGGLAAALDARLATARAPACGVALRVRIVATECSPVMLAGLRWALPGAAAAIQPWTAHFGNVVRGDHTDQFEVLNVLHNGPPLGDSSGDGGTTIELRAVIAADVVSAEWQGPAFDVVLTSFFIDAILTAPDITAVVDRTAALVADGGTWINIGPLQYHRPDANPKLSASELLAYLHDRHRLAPDTDVTGQPAGSDPIVFPHAAYSTPSYVTMQSAAHRPLFFALSRRSGDGVDTQRVQ